MGACPTGVHVVDPTNPGWTNTCKRLLTELRRQRHPTQSRAGRQGDPGARCGSMSNRRSLLATPEVLLRVSHPTPALGTANLELGGSGACSAEEQPNDYRAVVPR